MSKPYFDSIESKKMYFEQLSSFEKSFSRYSFFEKKLIKPQKIDQNSINLGRGGVPLSYNIDNESVFIDQTDAHTLVIGPTGSKKSRLVAMPTVKLLGYAKESMIISDPKAEIFNRTAHQLKNEGYNISVLNLRLPTSGDCWNPLAIPYRFFCEGDYDKAYEFVNDIAVNLTHTEKSVKDPFWDNSAGSLFFGLTLLLFKYCKEHEKNVHAVHIGNIIRLRNIMLSGDSSDIQNHPLWYYAKSDSFISSSLIGTVEAANNTRASILSVFDQKMRIFVIQPNLVNMLSHNTISLEEIDKSPTVFYLIIPDEKTSYHSLVSLFIKQSYEYLIYKAQKAMDTIEHLNGRMNNRVNYILDEFSSLPTIKDFPAMITAARSRNIRFNLFIQSKNQLLQRYAEETETIQSNCSNWIFLTSRELRLLEELSALCGNTKDNSKPVLGIADLQRLDKHSGEALVICGRLKPLIARLPDIDKYDNGKYKEYFHSINNENIASEYLNFELSNKRAKQNIVDQTLLKKFEMLGGNVSESMDVEQFIKRIDQKIEDVKKESN